MISLNFVMTLPQGMTADKFDEWYLEGHTKYGKNLLGIIRYSVNRTISTQPKAATGDVFRVAQTYWGDWDSLVECWNSPSGHADLGDGLVNIGLDPGTIPGVTLSADTQLPVSSPAPYSTVARGYRSREDGTHAKFLAYGLTDDRDAVRDWYTEKGASFGDDSNVREHVFGTAVGKKLEIGYLSTIPGPEQHLFDWNLELWFDTTETAMEFLETDAFTSVWKELSDKSTNVISALFRSQEMLVIADPLPHKDE